MTDRKLFNKLYPNIKDSSIGDLEVTPIYVRPVPTLSNKEDKFMTRYFIRRVTDNSLVVEVDKKQYSYFQNNPLYALTEIKWKIVGKKETIKQSNGIELFGTIDSNKIAVTKADLTFGGLRNYITNYSEFWLGES